jgi:hypothetical protein
MVDPSLPGGRSLIARSTEKSKETDPLLISSLDHTTANAFTRISGGLCFIIVHTTMNYNGFTQNIGFGIAADGPAVRLQLQASVTASVELNIANITGVKGAFAPFAMIFTGRVPVAAGVLAHVAAIGMFVKMHRYALIRFLRHGNLQIHSDPVAIRCESYRAADRGVGLCATQCDNSALCSLPAGCRGIVLCMAAVCAAGRIGVGGVTATFVVAAGSPGKRGGN